MPNKSKDETRKRRHRSLRKKLSGTPERPRLVVFRSARHIYAQVVDDLAGKTLAAASDVAKKAEKKLEGAATDANKRDRAKAVGAKVAQLCKDKGISQVVFDRGGFKYHGRISAVADGAREGGLEF